MDNAVSANMEFTQVYDNASCAYCAALSKVVVVILAPCVNQV